MLELIITRPLLLGALIGIARLGGAQAPARTAEPEHPPTRPPLVIHGDTLIFVPRTVGAHEMRALVRPETVFVLDGTRREKASPERARVARMAMKAFKEHEAGLIADSVFLSKHPEFRRVKP